MCAGERLTVVSEYVRRPLRVSPAPSSSPPQMEDSLSRPPFTFSFNSDGDFMMVRSSTTGGESYVPTSYTARVTHRWLFTGISRYKAVELLMLPNNCTGAFLIRESETSKDCYSLSVLRRTDSSYLDCVKHYRISHIQNGWLYISAGVTFPSLHQLVQHYSESDGLCCRLTEPCFIQGLDDTREARPRPTAIRRPTINWKDISRYDRWQQPQLGHLRRDDGSVREERSRADIVESDTVPSHLQRGASR
ncbi:Src-like-adapter 2 [Liparis tanakae]|uniref:Src-like-adapter 2 n=1 Tax=Liparis tanakae TaxID=230148 RepID=A0A4Z2GI83_9TELE|nr:Src-like-adapter 2 [Liparis tanakae]